MEYKVTVGGIEKFKDNPKLYKAVKKFAELLPLMKFKSADEHLKEIEIIPKTDWKKIKWFRYGENKKGE